MQERYLTQFLVAGLAAVLHAPLAHAQAEKPDPGAKPMARMPMKEDEVMHGEMKRPGMKRMQVREQAQTKDRKMKEMMEREQRK